MLVPSYSGADVPASLATPAALLDTSVALQDMPVILLADAPLDMPVAPLPGAQPPLDGPQPQPVRVRAHKGYLWDFVSSFQSVWWWEGKVL